MGRSGSFDSSRRAGAGNIGRRGRADLEAPLSNIGRMRILFVCLGNICRSPTAEAVFRVVAQRDAPDLALEIESAGTAGYHIGEPPDRRTQAAAQRRGYDMSAQRARQV